MNIFTAKEKIDILTPKQLKHMVQLVEDQIINYKRCCENYTEEQWKKYGNPHLRKLEEEKRLFEEKLNVL